MIVGLAPDMIDVLETGLTVEFDVEAVLNEKPIPSRNKKT